MAAIIPASQFRTNNVRMITYDTIQNIDIEQRQLNFVKNIFRQYAVKRFKYPKDIFLQDKTLLLMILKSLRYLLVVLIVGGEYSHSFSSQIAKNGFLVNPIILVAQLLVREHKFSL